MSEEIKYAKLSEVGEFTIINPIKSFWQKYNEADNTFEKKDDYFEGATQKFQIDTTAGRIDFSKNQLEQMFFGARVGLTSDINGKSFWVKTNGKQGKEIRYFINIKKAGTESASPTEALPTIQMDELPPLTEDEVDTSSIPF